MNQLSEINNNLFEKNKLVIKTRWPWLWQEINNTSINYETVEFVDKTPAKTLCINGIHISSCYNRIAEAQTQLSPIPEIAETVWVYGVGTGDAQLELTKRDSLKQINVVILSKSLFALSIKYFDHSRWLSDPRIIIVATEQESAVNFPYCAVPASLRFADAVNIRLRDLVQLELNSTYINAIHLNNPVFRKQIQQNNSLVGKDGDVSQLYSTKLDATAYVVGAGVSLTDNYKLLQNLKDNEFIIAVDGALRPLSRFLLKPHYIVAIDGNYIPMLSLFDVFLPVYELVPLIYFPVVENSILSQWRGARFCAYSSSPIYDDIKTHYPKGELFCSGSVIHAAVDLAVKMGCSTIKLLGADFSFLDGATHVEGHLGRRIIDVNTITSWLPNAQEKKSGSDTMVATTPNLIGYLRDLEHYISLHPDVQFFNMSRRGAKIMGASYPDEY